MRFLHTADWHLGRSFHGASLVEDQAHVLGQLVDLARQEQVDAVVVAGDIYDRALPPADAVSLLGDVLERLVAGAGIPVLLIAGNHDSAERIGFAGRIVERQGLYVRGTLERADPVVLQGRHGAPVAFHPLPYVEPAQARALPDAPDSLDDHAAAVAHMLQRLRAGHRAPMRQVLVGHAFVAGGAESDSERPLAVGGSGMVPPALFRGYDYVALGHLHRPQRAGADHIRYSGSLLKYSFHEAGHAKSVSLVTLADDGTATVVEHALQPRRDVRVVTGTLAQLLAGADLFGRDDYLSAQLTDPGPVLDPLARLRQVYPHVMEVRFRRNEQPAPEATPRADLRRRDPAQLFEAFWQDMHGSPLPAEQAEALRAFAQAALASDGQAQA